MLLQSATGITKCNDYYKVRQNTVVQWNLDLTNLYTTKFLANEKLDAFSFFQTTTVNTRIKKESIVSHVS